jgi:urease accessory protein
VAVKAKVHIEVGTRNDRSFLKRSLCQSPYKIADVTEDRRQKELNLMLMSSSPGILDEDEAHFEIDIAANASLKLETQSFQRIFQMKKGASQQMVVRLLNGSSFCYLPHPVVPHANSIYTSRNRIYLSAGCKLFWGEIISCGRKLNNEIFQFNSYHNITEIFLNEKLVVKENLLMKPLLCKPDGIGQLEGFTHQATFLYLDEDVKTDLLIECLTEALAVEKAISFGISTLPVNGVVIRMLGHKAEQLFRLQKHLLQQIYAGVSQSLLKPTAYV